jgi:hypothetical protein
MKKKTKSQLGKSARAKGHQWERDFVNQYWKSVDPSSMRMLEYQEGGDVDISTKLQYAIQCKCMGVWGGWKALEDLDNLPEDDERIKVGAIKQLNKGTCIVLPIEDFMRIVKDNESMRKFISTVNCKVEEIHEKITTASGS